ncbi:hypothetical protein Hanom_Chr13g01236391 [Helianthus anomalus]
MDVGKPSLPKWQTIANQIYRSNVVSCGEALPLRERRKERERGYGVGSIPISTNHTFFLFFKKNSFPLHQVFKPLPTFFTKV